MWSCQLRIQVLLAVRHILDPELTWARICIVNWFSGFYSTCIRKLLNLQCNRAFRERWSPCRKNGAMNVTARMVDAEVKPNQQHFFEIAKDSLGMVISSSSRPSGRTWLCFSVFLCFNIRVAQLGALSEHCLFVCKEYLRLSSADHFDQQKLKNVVIYNFKCPTCI